MDSIDRKADATDRAFMTVRASRPDQTDTRSKGDVAYVKPMGPISFDEEAARGGYTNTTQPTGN